MNTIIAKFNVGDKVTDTSTKSIVAVVQNAGGIIYLVDSQTNPVAEKDLVAAVIPASAPVGESKAAEVVPFPAPQQ